MAACAHNCFHSSECSFITIATSLPGNFVDRILAHKALRLIEEVTALIRTFVAAMGAFQLPALVGRFWL